MSFRFNSGGDLEIAVNGEILGGVRSLRRTTVCKGEGIYQFLTDKPVAKTESRQYTLDFSLHCLGVCVFENPVNSISVTDGEQTEIYTTVGGAPFLDMQYTVFGEVEEGLDVVEMIQNTATGRGDRPIDDIKMKISFIEH